MTKVLTGSAVKGLKGVEQNDARRNPLLDWLINLRLNVAFSQTWASVRSRRPTRIPARRKRRLFSAVVDNRRLSVLANNRHSSWQSPALRSVCVERNPPARLPPHDAISKQLHSEMHQIKADLWPTFQYPTQSDPLTFDNLIWATKDKTADSGVTHFITTREWYVLIFSVASVCVSVRLVRVWYAGTLYI